MSRLNRKKPSLKRTVKRVLDGDTFEVKRRVGKFNRIRLSNVNAPEKKGRGGKKATSILRGLVGGKKVSITPHGRSYNRVVAKVTQNRKNINEAVKKKLSKKKR